MAIQNPGIPQSLLVGFVELNIDELMFFWAGCRQFARCRRQASKFH
jgi:hypothetical protein